MDPQRPFQPDEASRSTKTSALNALSWIGGILLAIGGIGGLMTSPIMGLLVLLAAAVLLPPVNAWAARRFSFRLTATVKAAVIVLLLGGAVWYNMSQEKGQQDRATRAEFEKNKAAVLEQIDSALSAHDYARARAVGAKYAGAVSDSQFQRRYDAVLAHYKHAQDVATERELLERVNSLPADSLTAKRDGYRELLSLNPTNTGYKTKLADYDNRVRQEATAQQEWTHRFGPPPLYTGAAGMYVAVKVYLPQVLNDPTSLSGLACTRVFRSTRGWLVGCYYRATNQFGGVVRYDNWFIIQQDRVVEMLPAPANYFVFTPVGLAGGVTLPRGPQRPK